MIMQFWMLLYSKFTYWTMSDHIETRGSRASTFLAGRVVRGLVLGCGAVFGSEKHDTKVACKCWLKTRFIHKKLF